MGAPIGNLNGVKWTTEQDEILKRLYAEGVSCRNIASYIPGKTRNSVIGRVHRMKLPLRGQNRRDPDKPVIRKKRTNLGRPGLLRPNQPRPSKDETVMRCAAIGITSTGKGKLPSTGTSFDSSAIHTKVRD